MEVLMKRLISAAIAILAIGAGAVVAQPLSHGAPPTANHQAQASGN
jgi:hypothetical protein